MSKCRTKNILLAKQLHFYRSFFFISAMTLMRGNSSPSPLPRLCYRGARGRVGVLPAFPFSLRWSSRWSITFRRVQWRLTETLASPVHMKSYFVFLSNPGVVFFFLCLLKKKGANWDVIFLWETTLFVTLQNVWRGTYFCAKGMLDIFHSRKKAGHSSSHVLCYIHTKISPVLCGIRKGRAN